MWTRVKQSLKKLDMFSTTEFLRYKEETQYATLTGACLSVGIFLVIFLLVYQVLLSTINRDKVTWTMETEVQSFPSDLTMNIGQMKFGIISPIINLNDENISYADIGAFEMTTVNGQETTRMIPVSACNAEDWNQTEQVRQVFENNNGTNWLCPDPTQNITLGGRWTSSSDKTLMILVMQCGRLYPWKTNCANSTQMTQFLSSDNEDMAIMVVNPLIQPNKVQPVKYYVDDQNTMAFSTNLAQFVNVDVSEYEIETDNSLLPFSSYQTEKGFMLSGHYRAVHAQRTSHGFICGARFRKSPNKIKYSRSFNKIDETLSYAGGLIGVVVGIFFLMTPYTELSFELSLANRLFAEEDGQPVKQEFNFFNYIGYGVYWLLNCCCECVSWAQFAKYEQCSQQIQKELDISYQLKRINTLERTMGHQNKHSVNESFSYHRITLQESDEKFEAKCDSSQAQNSHQSSQKSVGVPKRGTKSLDDQHNFHRRWNLGNLDFDQSAQHLSPPKARPASQLECQPHLNTLSQVQVASKKIRRKRRNKVNSSCGNRVDRSVSQAGNYVPTFQL